MQPADVDEVFEQVSCLTDHHFVAFTLVFSHVFCQSLVNEEFQAERKLYETTASNLISFLSDRDRRNLDVRVWPGVSSRNTRVTFIEYAFQFLVLAREYVFSDDKNSLKKRIISEFAYDFDSIFSMKFFKTVDFGDMPSAEYKKMRTDSGEYRAGISLVYGIKEAIVKTDDDTLRQAVQTLLIIVGSVFSKQFYDEILELR